MYNLLMTIGFLILFLGLPSSIIATIVLTVKKNKRVVIPAVCIPTTFVVSVVLIGIGGYMYGQTDEYKEIAEQQEIERQQIEYGDGIEKEEEEQLAQKRVEEHNAEEEEQLVQQKEENIESKTIFAMDLLENWDDYIGDCVTVSFEVSLIRNLGDGVQICSPYYDGITQRMKATIQDEEEIREGDWVAVMGIVGEDSHDGLQDAIISGAGSEVEEVFQIAKAEYDERKAIEAEIYEAEKKQAEEEYEVQFKENAESPIYDDLLRYPDSYKEKQIKIVAKIVRVEPEGIIFDGEIEATMNGEVIALYDNRDVKEPKMLEGDYVTIYGYGKGTVTVKVQDVSGWLPKTIDKYDIPAIDIRYIEFD